MAKIRRTQLVTVEITYTVDEDADIGQGYVEPANWNFWEKMSEGFDWNHKILDAGGRPSFTVEHAGPMIEKEIENG